MEGYDESYGPVSGIVYRAKMGSGKIIPFKFLRIRTAYGSSRKHYVGINMESGREVELKSKGRIGSRMLMQK